MATARDRFIRWFTTAEFIITVGETASHMLGRLNGVSQGGKQENGAVGTRGPMSSQATIAAANTFPGTHVMILLYYANYAVPTHGQWCILMAMAAQRGAVTIDQSCFGYANSAQAGKREPLTENEERVGAEDR